MRKRSEKKSHPKKIRFGTTRKSKNRPLMCKHCGGWFANLGEINRHYSAAGHKKTKRPSKKLKLKEDYPPEKIERAIALLNILEDPVAFKRKLKEHMEKKLARRSGF